jgi:hypothetical protein
LAGNSIEVRAQPVNLYTRRTPESCHGRLGTDESMATQWRELADRNAISRHHEGLALVKAPHDLAAAIAQLALGDVARHDSSVAHVLRYARRCEH